MAPSAPTRWRPTPEQVMILEELYRNGVKTPNAPQIQRITSHLSLYGKIQGKSVFYWFQNHKAREKKKLRKKLVLKHLQLQQQKQEEEHGKCALVDDHHPLEVIMEQEQSNHNLLSISHASPLNFHQLSHHDYSTSFPWGGSQVMDLSWNMETPQRVLEDSNVEMRSTSDHAYLLTKIMEDVDSLYTYCSTNASPTRTLKPLELFPLTPTNLKENCNPSSSNDLSSFNSIN